MAGGKQLDAWGPPDGREVFHSNCPAVQVLDHVTSRWGVWVLMALRDGRARFFELRERIDGISEKMLSQTLRNLVRDGLVWREVEPTTPPKVTYGLTALGKGTSEPLAAMFDWIRGNADTIQASRSDFDETRSRLPASGGLRSSILRWSGGCREEEPAGGQGDRSDRYGRPPRPGTAGLAAGPVIGRSRSVQGIRRGSPVLPGCLPGSSGSPCRPVRRG
nr:helix-turn-helix domain-containing protein [Glycomyces salinus]